MKVSDILPDLDPKIKKILSKKIYKYLENAKASKSGYIVPWMDLKNIK